MAASMTRMPSSENIESVKSSPLSMSRVGRVGARVDERRHHRQRREQAEQVAHRVGDDHPLHRVVGRAARRRTRAGRGRSRRASVCGEAVGDDRGPCPAPRGRRARRRTPSPGARSPGGPDRRLASSCVGVASVSELGDRGMAEQLGHRGVHDVGERLRDTGPSPAPRSASTREHQRTRAGRGRRARARGRWRRRRSRRA